MNDTPWTVAVWLPDGAYRVLAAFPDRQPARDFAAEAPGRMVLFRPVWRMRRRHSDDF